MSSTEIKIDSPKIDWHKKNRRRSKIKHNGKRYKLNFNKRPLDKKIKKFAATSAAASDKLVAAPPTLDLRPYLTPIRDQGENGDCVAFSCACTKEYQNYVASGETKPGENIFQLSPWFIYGNANTTAPNSCDEGLDITQGFDVIKNLGVAPEMEFETPKTCPATMPIVITEKAKTEALKHKIHSYHEITTFDNLKTSLANFGPCPIGFEVFNFSPTFWKKNDGDSSQGGHCVSVVGYFGPEGDKNGNHKDSFIIRNSWGESWADKGYSYWPFLDFGNQLELYSANNLTGSTVAPSIKDKILVNPPGSLPTPTPTPIPTPIPTPVSNLPPGVLPLPTPSPTLPPGVLPLPTPSPTLPPGVLPLPTPGPTIAPGILTPTVTTSTASTATAGTETKIAGITINKTTTIILSVMGGLLLLLFIVYFFFLAKRSRK